MSDRDLLEWNTDGHGETSAGPFLLRGEGEVSAVAEAAVDAPREASGTARQCRCSNHSPGEAEFAESAPLTPQEAQVPDPQRAQLGRPLPAKQPVSDSFAVPYRWIAKISIFKGNKFDSHGSGVLISDRHVLTAAHVLDDVIRSPGQFHLEVNLALDGRDSLGPYPAAKAPDIAPKYDPSNKDDVDNDFAIITLNRPVDRDTAKRLKGDPLCFWGSSSCGAGTTSIPVGGGSLKPARRTGRALATRSKRASRRRVNSDPRKRRAAQRGENPSRTERETLNRMPCDRADLRSTVRASVLASASPALRVDLRKASPHHVQAVKRFNHDVAFGLPEDFGAAGRHSLTSRDARACPPSPRNWCTAGSAAAGSAAAGTGAAGPSSSVKVSRGVNEHAAAKGESTESCIEGGTGAGRAPYATASRSGGAGGTGGEGAGAARAGKRASAACRSAGTAQALGYH
jgi:hypothetical protein